MKRYFVIFLGAITLLALVGAAGLGFLLAKFDPNDYKSQFQAALEEATGWKITLHDELSINFLPTITLNTGRLSVEIPGAPQGQPAYAEALTLSLSGEHLHQGFLDVQEITLQGLNLSRGVLPASLSLQGGDEPELSEALRSLAEKQSPPEAAPLPAEQGGSFAAPVRAGQQGVGGIRLQARFPGKKLTLENAAISGKDANGAEDWTLLLAHAEFANLGMNAEISFSASGVFSDSLNLKKTDFSLEGAGSLSENGALRARLSSLHMRLEGIGDLPIAMEGALGVDYNLHTASLSLKDMKGNLRLADGRGAGDAASSGSDFGGSLAIVPPKDGLAGAITGELQADRLNLDMLLHGLDPSVRFIETGGESVKGAPNFTRPKVTRVLAAATGTQLAKTAAKNEYPAYNRAPKSSGEAPLLLALASKYSLSLNFKANELVAGGMQLGQLSLQTRSTGGRGSMPFSFILYGASVTGAASFAAAAKSPSFALSCQVKGMHMGKLSSAWTSNYYIGGVGNGYLELSGQSGANSDVVNSLKGKASFEVVNGEVQGFDLIPPDLPYFQNLPDNFLFRRLSARAEIEAGKAAIQDILLESDMLQGKGSGIIHLSFGQLDIGMNFTQEGRYAAVPVFISGPYASLSTTVDAASYNKSLDRTELGQYYDGYNSPYSNQGDAAYDRYDGYGGQNAYGQDPYRRPDGRGGSYAVPQQARDPYMQYLDRAPLSGVQWQTQTPRVQPPQGASPSPAPQPAPREPGKVPPLGNPADIIYGR